MTRTIESLLRFVNLTTAGLLAGSLGFGDAALMPGWQLELPLRKDRRRKTDIAVQNYFNAIGPVALGTAVTLAVGSRGVRPLKRVLDKLAPRPPAPELYPPPKPPRRAERRVGEEAPPVATLSALKLRRDVIEYTGQAGADQLECGNRRHRDQSGDQPILDSGCPGVVAQ